MKIKYFVSLCVTFVLLSDYKSRYHLGHEVKRKGTQRDFLICE